MNQQYKTLHGPQGDQPGDVLQAGDEWEREQNDWLPISACRYGDVMKPIMAMRYRRPLPPCRHEGRFDVLLGFGFLGTCDRDDIKDLASAWSVRCHDCGSILRLMDGVLVPVGEEISETQTGTNESQSELKEAASASAVAAHVEPVVRPEYTPDPTANRVGGNAPQHVPPVCEGEKPRVVCLCGSSKHPEIHMRLMMDETLAGRIVIPMGLYGHADFPAGAKAATNDGDESTSVKQMLDRLHFSKIDLADEILVVRMDGYIGSSTSREIEYANSTSKTIRFYDTTPPSVANDAKAGTETPRMDSAWNYAVKHFNSSSRWQQIAHYLQTEGSEIELDKAESERRALAAESKLVAAEKERDAIRLCFADASHSSSATTVHVETLQDQLRLATDRVRALEEAFKEAVDYVDDSVVLERLSALLSTPATATGKEEGK